MSIRLTPIDYTELDEWSRADYQQECCHLSALNQQQQHLIDNLAEQLHTKDIQIGKLEQKIRYLKSIAEQIVRASAHLNCRVKAGQTNPERMVHLYAGGQDD